MQLLMHGKHSLTLSSIRTGGMFSPPAVMINSTQKQTPTAITREKRCRRVEALNKLVTIKFQRTVP